MTYLKNNLKRHQPVKRSSQLTKVLMEGILKEDKKCVPSNAEFAYFCQPKKRRL
jgi:hypothetical protein